MKALIWVLRSPLTVNTPPHRAAKKYIFLTTKDQETRWQSRKRNLFAAIMIKRWSTETALPATQTGYGILIRVCECVTEKHALNWQTMFWIPLFCEIRVCGWPVSLVSGEFLPVFYWFYWNLFIVNLYQVDETNGFPNVWDIFAAELLLRSAYSLSV